MLRGGGRTFEKNLPTRGCYVRAYAYSSMWACKYTGIVGMRSRQYSSSNGLRVGQCDCKAGQRRRTS